MSVRKFSVLLALAVVVFVVSFSAHRSVLDAPVSENTEQLITFGGRRFQVEIADTDEKRMKGLGGREGIANNEGMLFVFEEPDKHCFWMKDVTFSLDIFWFDESHQIVHRALEVPPESYPNNFCSPEAAKYVLEIRGGEAALLDQQLQLEL